MRPDFSVLLLTTLIGAGQGLFLALVTAQLYALFGLLPPQDGRLFHAGGSVLALALLAAGLAASFFHLGRPGRAWRAAAQWRTSWLSREVIVLPLLMAVVTLYGAAHWLDWRPPLAVLPSGLVIDAIVGLAVAGTVFAFILYGCTAMIYAGLPVMREWATLLTPLNFTLLGGASGFTLAAAFAIWSAPELPRFFAGWALILTVLGFGGRAAALIRIRRLRPKSTLQTALGVKHPRIAQSALFPKGGAFNAGQFFHGAAPSRLRGLTWLFMVGAFATPASLLALCLAGAPVSLLLPAAAVQYLGMLVERWCFFAEARHPQNLYFAGRPEGAGTPPGPAPVAAAPARLESAAPRPQPGSRVPKTAFPRNEERNYGVG